MLCKIFQTDFAKDPFSEETFPSPKNIILRIKLWQYCGKCWPLEMSMGLRVWRPGLWFWSDASNFTSLGLSVLFSEMGDLAQNLSSKIFWI